MKAEEILSLLPEKDLAIADQRSRELVFHITFRG